MGKQEGIEPQKVTLRNPSSVFKIGDSVRLSKAKRVFDKGYLPNYTEEIFTVSKILNTKPIQYKVRDYHNIEIEGSFYAAEMQLVVKPDDYVIERILASRGKGRKKEYLIKWLGYPKQFNLWQYLDKQIVKNINFA